MIFIFAFIISLVSTMVLIPPVMRWADKIGAIDIPDARKVHTQAIPRVGGIAMVAGMSQLYSIPRFLITIALAVAPVPLAYYGWHTFV